MAYPPPGGGYGYPPGGGAYPPTDPMYPPGAGAYPPGAGAYPPGGGAYPPGAGAYPPAGGMPGYGAPPGPGFPPAGGYGGPPPAGFNAGGPPMPGGPAGYPAQPYGGVPPAQGYQPAATQAYGVPTSGHAYQQPPGQQYGAQPGYQQPPAQGYAPQQPPAQGYAPQQPPAQGYAPQKPPAQGYQQPGPPQGYQQQQPPSQGYQQQQPPSQSYQQPAAGQPAPARPAAQPVSTAPSTAPLASQMAGMSLKPMFHGTVIPISPFDAERDCEALRKSMRGMGTDEAALIEILASRSNAQRVEIRKRYKTMFGKDLMNDLKSELSGNLEECLLAMMEPGILYDSKCLRRAMRGAGTDEESLIDILCTRSNRIIEEIKREYKAYYQRDLEKDCVSETSGHFKRLLVSMCQGNRDETEHVDMEKAKKEATDLFQAGEKKWGTDESRFNVVLVSRSYPQLRATFNEYVKVSQRDLLNSIEREMSGDLKAGFKCIVQCARNAPEYFADRLYRSMKGAGTDDSLLIRLVVSRSEIDLVDIKQEFLRKYHKTLYKMIEGDCSGDYKKLLLALVKMN